VLEAVIQKEDGGMKLALNDEARVVSLRGDADGSDGRADE
jgi:hypothetical protein